MEKQKQDGDPFALFVRAVEGAMVRRYGHNKDIGVVADGKGSVTWDVETIHAFTHDEVAQYGHLYRREIKAKPPRLIEVTREDWDKARSLHMDRKAEAKKAAEKVAEEVAKNNEASPPISAKKGGV